jgi:hypothetical protein
LRGLFPDTDVAPDEELGKGGAVPIGDREGDGIGEFVRPAITTVNSENSELEMWSDPIAKHFIV